MKKAPNKKRENAACGSACLRAAAPPSSLASFLSSFGGCAATLPSLLASLLPLLYLPLMAASPPTSCALLLPSPRLPRLLWAAAPPSLFVLLLLLPRLLPSLLWAAAPPLYASFLPLSRLFSASFAAAPPHTTPRSRGRLVPPPLSPLSFLSIKQLTILSVAVTSHELICSPLDFASARHPKGPLSKATGFLHILP